HAVQVARHRARGRRLCRARLSACARRKSGPSSRGIAVPVRASAICRDLAPHNATWLALDWVRRRAKTIGCHNPSHVRQGALPFFCLFTGAIAPFFVSCASRGWVPPKAGDEDNETFDAHVGRRVVRPRRGTCREREGGTALDRRALAGPWRLQNLAY